MQQPPTRQSWFSQSHLEAEDYQALLAYLRYTPWGEDWAGAQAYSRAPGLSVEQLDWAWHLERWRFARQAKRKWETTWRWSLPSPQIALMMAGLALFGSCALPGIAVASDWLGVVLLGIVVLVLGVSAILMWRDYAPYRRAKRAYQARRAALSRQDR